MQVVLPVTAPKLLGGRVCVSDKACLDLGFAVISQPCCTMLLPWLPILLPCGCLLPLEWGRTYACSFPYPDAVALQLEILGQHVANL